MRRFASFCVVLRRLYVVYAELRYSRHRRLQALAAEVCIAAGGLNVLMPQQFLHFILYGHRPPIARGNLYMAHRCGFTEKVLSGTLQSSGFKRVAPMKLDRP